MAPGNRLLAMDLDGTLLRSDQTISARNQAAVADCLARGIHVVLATGRVHRAATRYAAHWPGHSIWVIAGNGAVVRSAAGGPPIWAQTMPREAACAVIRWAQAAGLNLRTYVDEEMLVFAHSEPAARFCQARGLSYRVVPDLATSLSTGPTKMVLEDEPEQVSALEEEARRRWGDALSIMRSEPQYLEFMAPGVTKGTALRVLADYLGVAQADVAAIGNERNDLAMIEWAGFGGVVANAIPEVKAVAPRVYPHHDADGVAAFIQDWLSR
jgi:Cof subfamily protein (haloacid dehalogenase superfamily)